MLHHHHRPLFVYGGNNCTTASQFLLRFVLFFFIVTAAMVSESSLALSQESLKELSRLPHMRNHWLVVQHRKQQQRIATTTLTSRRRQQQQQQQTTTTPDDAPLLGDTDASSIIITQQPPSPSATIDEMIHPTLVLPTMLSSSSSEEEEDENVGEEDEATAESERGERDRFQQHDLTSVVSKLTTTTTMTTTTTTTTAATIMLEKEQQQQQQVVNSSSSSSSLSISEAKEKLKARRNKSRKKVVASSSTSTSSDDTWNKPDQIQPLQTPPPPSPLSLSSSSSNREESDAVEAKKHIIRMQQSGASCSQPSARLVYVRHNNVRYLPECTWLHRCSDDAGCCPDESQTCSPANIQSVSLPFFALTMVGHETRRTVTRLTFENHTRCECVGRNADLMPRTEPERPSAQIPLPLSVYQHQQQHRHRQHHQRHIIKEPSTLSRRSRQQRHQSTPIPIKRLLRQHKIIRPSAVTKCRCPSGYNAASTIGHHHHKRHCVCQCSSAVSSKKCTQTSRGLDTFSPRDQRCIDSKRCQVPQCLHGRYIPSLGRCPLAAKS